MTIATHHRQPLEPDEMRQLLHRARSTPLGPARPALEPDEMRQLLHLAARWIAPYLSSRPAQEDGLKPGFDDQTCTVFVRELGDDVIDRSLALFGALAQEGEMTSVELAAQLGATPRELSGLLTGSVKKRAQRLGLRLPFDIDETPDGLRTVWRDRDGIAERMLDALLEEQKRRTGLGPIIRGKKYGPLEQKLRGEGVEVNLDFEEIEAIIGEPLPPSARGRRQWWSNQVAPGGHIQAEAWMNAGFRAFPNLRAEKVTFRRM